MPYESGTIIPSSFTFEEISIGKTFKLSHTVTLEDVMSFAKLTGDYNPLHVDSSFAERTTFGKQVVHGMLTASFVSTIIGMLIPGPGSLWLSQTIQFSKPTFIGDDITVIAKVKAKSNSTRTISLEINIFNQNKEKLISGESTVRMLDVIGKKKRILQ
jgi:acyl dehydratase